MNAFYTQIPFTNEVCVCACVFRSNFGSAKLLLCENKALCLKLVLQVKLARIANECILHGKRIERERERECENKNEEIVVAIWIIPLS